MRRSAFVLCILFFTFACSGPNVRELVEERRKLKDGLASCQAQLEEARKPAPEKKTDAGEKKEDDSNLPKGVRVVLVSVDGFHSDLVEEMPIFKDMLIYGAWTLKARAPHPAITTVSHATMFTGVDPGEHGVQGGAPKGDALTSWDPLLVETLFQRLDKEKARPSAFIQKRKLENLLPKSAFQTVRLDARTGEDATVFGACREIKMKGFSRFIFMHLKRLDTVGHRDGWLSEEQKAAARTMDESLGEIVSCIAAAEASHGDTFALIITTDHGGHGTTHGSDTDSDRNVPWLIIAPDVKSDFRIDDHPDITIALKDTTSWMRRYLNDVLVGAPRVVEIGDPRLLK